MAKQSGLGNQLFIGGNDVGANISAISNISTPRATLPATNITQSANARLFGKRDASADFSCYFDPAANASHSVLRALPTTDTQVMYLLGTTIGGEAFSMNAKQVNYDGTRADDGSFMFAVNVPSNGFGADWGNTLTAGTRSDTTATNGAGVDFATAANPASAAFGFQAYLQVFSFTGTSVTIKLQESSDNGGGDAFADITGGGFTVVSAAPTFQRIQSTSDTLTVERYVRVVTTGTFSQCSFAVAFTRNDSLRVL
jgi:hypothetical protein